MSETDSNSTGFSRGRRWLTSLNLLASALAMLALVVMANYVAQGHFRRYQLAEYTSYKLSPQTLRVLHSLTNDVQVTIFYERSDGDVYQMICGLLAEYQNASPHIKVKTLDYEASPGDASALLERLHLADSKARDFVAFESNGHSEICPGGELSNYNIAEALRGLPIRRTQFLGEARFTDLIFAVSYPREMKAYFLAGHGEMDPGTPDDKEATHRNGMSKLAGILKDEIDCHWERLWLSGTNPIPADCKLLIIATPPDEIAKLTTNELSQIQTYLQHDNGRLLALLGTTEGLDGMLSNNWGVVVGPYPVKETDKNSLLRGGPAEGLDFLATPAMDPNQEMHAIIKPLFNERLRVRMILPRPIFASGSAARQPGAPTIAPLISTTTNAVQVMLTNGVFQPVPGPPIAFPLLAAIEQGVITGRDGTRMVVAGDAYFLSDRVIDSMAANHYLAKQILNWLLHRNEIALEGLGPRPIREYRLTMTEAQTRQLRGLFLGVMPGSVLLLGGLVWLRRRS